MLYCYVPSSHSFEASTARPRDGFSRTWDDQPISRWSHNGCTPYHILVLNSGVSLCLWCCGLSVNMSDLSRTVPEKQLPSEDLHPPPMPVINLGHLSLDSTTRSRVIDDIAKACRDLGYFQVINHGISQSVMDAAVDAASDFFKLPSEAKEEFASDDLRQPIRYDTSSKDSISMSRAFLKHYAHPLSDWIQYWPRQSPIYRQNSFYKSFLFTETREYMGKYAVEVRRVALQLMEAILEGLGLGKEYLHEKFQEGLQLLSVNCYPKASQGATTIGLAPHSDYGFLTILLTSCQGLEVVDRSSNSWKRVQQLPHAFHVHVGDHMEVLSNGRIKTVVHSAVLNPEEARISIASIHGFALHEKVACAKDLVDEQNPQKYKESSFNDFLDHLIANIDNKHRNFLESLRL
ncbi:flavanone 3-dioxygenase 3-like [Phragmites australis]|uniref:flavanone 3-dioxygenase 3-like n=1 Tax=Phragmites australis TaxID=29695 RepID=UPI002D7A4078|nr:flavanone 3-dioxygenase 3-like [Phragmites australis]